MLQLSQATGLTRSAAGASISPVLTLTGVAQAGPQDWLNRERPPVSCPPQEAPGWT
ncbi:hypothetical protein [Archangium sp.]|uniref:hypothetical protein n=1 Tax=Archangium sp. TaxID=1872627 RepID=UPI00286AE05B|nr:hypothetical protein [Archangium sp.]